jgi:hypothetical protein
MSRLVEANEPDTINYQFYLNRAETKCIVNETYANSEAVLAHITGVASQTILPKIFSVSRISRCDVYENPSEKLQNQYTSRGYFPDLQRPGWLYDRKRYQKILMLDAQKYQDIMRQIIKERSDKSKAS